MCKDYLVSNEIVNDLNSLLEVMDIYDQNGIKEFELSYGLAQYTVEVKIRIYGKTRTQLESKLEK